MEDKELCPECLGTKKAFRGRLKAKGFEYLDCNFCDSEGMVPEGSLNKTFINDGE